MREQVVLVFRHVDDDFNVHEDFVGLHQVHSEHVSCQVSRTVLWRGYDSNMTGAKRGVSTDILVKKERAVFAHC